MGNKEFFVDEPVVASFWIGEFGWLISRWQGYLRHLKHNIYPDHKFLIMMDLSLHPLVNDFVNYTIDLPNEFKKLGLEKDCTESPLPNSPPGSLTPPNVYAALLEYLRHFYSKDKVIEAFPPRGAAFRITDAMPQVFCKLETDKIKLDKPIVCVFPRARVRTPERNVPEFIWKGVVQRLIENNFVVVLGGTPNDSALVDYEDENVINLIKYNDEDKLSRIIQYLNSSVCSISSQSGSTHLSLTCDCPSYIIGHEEKRHTVTENSLDTPTSFRYVYDYRAIDANTIIEDVRGFIKVLEDNGYFNVSCDKIINEDISIMRDMMGQYKSLSTPVLTKPSLHNLLEKKDLVGVEIGTYKGEGVYKIFNNLSISKLYTIDPYNFKNLIAGVNFTKEDAESLKQSMKNALSVYGDKIEIINKTSIEAANLISERLDFVYLDGDHSYETVKKELELYYPKVKSGGLLAGHDFNGDDNGVERAVVEFFSAKGLQVNTNLDLEDGRTNEWWIIKDSVENWRVDDGRVG